VSRCRLPPRGEVDTGRQALHRDGSVYVLRARRAVVRRLFGSMSAAKAGSPRQSLVQATEATQATDPSDLAAHVKVSHLATCRDQDPIRGAEAFRLPARSQRSPRAGLRVETSSAAQRRRESTEEVRDG